MHSTSRPTPHGPTTRTARRTRRARRAARPWHARSVAVRRACSFLTWPAERRADRNRGRGFGLVSIFYVLLGFAFVVPCYALRGSRDAFIFVRQAASSSVTGARSARTAIVAGSRARTCLCECFLSSSSRPRAVTFASRSDRSLFFLACRARRHYSLACVSDCVDAAPRRSEK